MRLTTRLSTCVVLAAVLALTGCAETSAPAALKRILPEGKEDNFYSSTAREYRFTSVVTLTLEAAYQKRAPEERESRARALMEGKTKQIAWYLHVYLIDKEHGDDDAAEYGGVRAMVLDGSEAATSLQSDPDDPLKYTFTFAVEVGGANNLVEKIRHDKGLDRTARAFPLEMPDVPNESLVGFDEGGDPGSWAPEVCHCDLQTVELSIETISRSVDAYLDYGSFYADGTLDIGVHYGWDYHARYDITHARALYRWLTKTLEFSSPAASFESYHRRSGPLQKNIEVNGRTIAVRVWVFHPDPCLAWDEDDWSGSWVASVGADEGHKRRACEDWSWPDVEAVANPTTAEGAGRMKQDLIESLQTRDVTIFSGHSGYRYGFEMGSWYRTARGALDPPEIKTLELPADRSQLVVLSGCQTYHVGQAFRENPAKKGLTNLDVITTSSFSSASSTAEIKATIVALTGGYGPRFKASSYADLMKGLNQRTYDTGWGNFAMYGVHGIDDNPRANPLGDAAESCKSCDTDHDCKAVGNVCVALSDQQRVCAVGCVDASGCGEKERCASYSDWSGDVSQQACVPKSGRCE